MQQTEQRTALVTGASTGIGRAIARRLAADGARVAVHYGRDTPAAEQTVAAIRDTGGQAFAVRADLADPAAVDTVFDALAEHADRLDVLVHNAAVVGTADLAGSTPMEFDRVFAVNVRAPVLLTRRALALLPDGGRVVFVSSAVTRTAPREICYAASKGAVNTLARTLAQQLGPRGITVNAVSPGATRTGLWAQRPGGDDILAAAAAGTALGRAGTPEDIADVVAFLCGADARWVTGEVLEASGGLYLRPG